MSSAPSLTSLRAFATVGQCLSFTEGAHRLGVTQSAVSRQIRQLESTLDIALFRRIGNAVELTEAGAILHDRLAGAFDLIDDAVQEARKSVPRQKLTLLAPPTFAARWLSRRLVSFRQRFPDLDLSLHLSPDDNVRFDCVIRFGTDPRDRQSSTRLMVEQHIAVCAPDLWADPERLRASCLLYVLDRALRLPTWDNWFASAQHDRRDLPENAMEFATLDMVTQAAVSGAGLAVIDRNMIESELVSGALIQIDPVVVTGPYGYWLDIPTERLARSRVVHFARWMQQLALQGTRAPAGD
ncbi:LysR substrate-binding domain-containing protein [Paracoccus sp. IB05]|uniref:LysR substrate-binding domain-containing protein n=1 Tax=Paracoccus sp. IB05 TaxID=2779367 RepID=UPI0018E87863|nr:LysR substrate-binding domain-containing protein [Paracoccus sp. IB05]MBJ2153346.1 LysR family transcriptional regulator [Paracoccus sp. IB05]